MASKAAYRRVRTSPMYAADQRLISAQLSKEYIAMQKEPPPFVWAAPDEKNILTCESYGLVAETGGLTTTVNREFHHRMSTVEHWSPVLAMLIYCRSEVRLIPLMPAGSSMAFFSSRRNTPSSHQASRYVITFTPGIRTYHTGQTPLNSGNIRYPLEWFSPIAVQSSCRMPVVSSNSRMLLTRTRRCSHPLVDSNQTRRSASPCLISTQAL